MMVKYLLRLRFVGTDFCGWQYQPGVRTVQDTLTAAANAVFGAKCAVTGCSRTDSGVHAEDFAAMVETADTANRIPCGKIPAAFTPHLPHDLAVVSAALVDADFHPRYRMVAKTYCYKIECTPIADPLLFGRVWHFASPILPDAEKRMNECAALLIGRQDFAAFMAAGSKIEDTVRTVSDCRVLREGDLLVLYIKADGFLYNMVRIIAGTLMLAAVGKLDADGMRRILAGRDRAAAGVTAPPEGLYLHKVEY